jgi:hypothetical protein
MKKFCGLNAAFVALLLAICLTSSGLWAMQTTTTRKPEKLRLDTVWIAGTRPEEVVFVVNNVIGYKSVESLRAAVANLPSGSTLTWFPRPLGAPRLPPDEKGMDDFRRFCAERNIELIVILGE